MSEKRIDNAVYGDAISPHAKPYLSIVTTSRNDNYGGDGLRRMQISLSSHLEQLEKYHIESELVLVEWNPPEDSPRLKDVLMLQERTKYCTIRFIVVTASIHHKYDYSDRIPLKIPVAFNCGIRRARGVFVLPANSDVLYSDDLMSYLAMKKLKNGNLYRIDRCDVDRDVLRFDNLQEQLAYCQDHIILVKKHGPQKRRQLRWPGVKMPSLHTSACGDFQLMSREHWHRLRGLREADNIYGHADALLSYAAYAAGLREVILDYPMRLYHIDHERNLTNLKEHKSHLPGEKVFSLPFIAVSIRGRLINLYTTLLFHTGYRFENCIKGIPTIHYLECVRMCREMVAHKRSYVLNNEDWGLGNESLEIINVRRADWDE